MEAQMPTYKGVKGITGPISYKKEEKKINYLADRSREIHIKSPSLSKISVAVFVDGTYERDAFGRLKYDKEGKPIYKPRTAEEMRKYEDIVWAAIGAEKGKEYLDREYIVSVKNVQFDRTAEWALELREERMLRKHKITILSLVGIVGLLMILGLFLLFIKLIKRPRVEVALPAPTLPPGVPLPPPEEVPERARMIEEAKRLTREKPMVVADLIRTWLAEE
jgi:flagellar M-ring protein FliF